MANIRNLHLRASAVLAILITQHLASAASAGASVAVTDRVATEFHVAASGSDTNAGSKNAPFKTIQQAAGVAQPGDVITVHAGVYRERVDPPRGGADHAQRIVYQAAPGEKVVITGSEPVKGWVKVTHDTWKMTLPNKFFGDFNPYGDLIGGEWYAAPGWSRHTGAVYVNDGWLTEARALEAVLQPAGAEALWFGSVDARNTTIWGQFAGVDPNVQTVEINVRQSVFYPSQPGRNFITVRGFTMRNAATPWSGAMSEQIGLVGTHWSKGWIIEDNDISYSMNTGITLGRYDLGRYGIAKPPVTAPGFVESCEHALRHGWSKDKIGGHVVRNNHISHCEKNGIHGSLGGIFSTIEGNTIHDIAQKGWICGPDVAGLKLLGSVDTLIKDNHIHHCGGSGAVWLDWMAQGARFTGNLLHDNIRDLFMEVNHGPFLIDNNVFLSRRSVDDWSQGGGYAHNLFMGSFAVRAERRQTPYFKPHTVADMRLSDIRKTDQRFHNNVFAGGSGTAPFNPWAGTPRASGNVYLAGTTPSAGEGGAVVNPGFNPGVKLTERPAGEWWLEMAVDPGWLSARTRSPVTTALLGTAVVPNAAFEQPDATPYRLDRDYCGARRNAANPAPGPFEFTAGSTIRLKVWPR
jgi:alpha-N-arabinofuranosidase